jgi:hypothetical protein
MKTTIKRGAPFIILVLTALAILAAFLVSFKAAATGTMSVSGNTSAGENQPGWMFNRDTNTSAPYIFTHDKASLGIGSLYAGPIDGTNDSSKFIAEYFPGTLPVPEFQSLSYDYLIGQGGDQGDVGQFYVNIYANIDNSTNYYDCRYDYVAGSGSTDTFTKIYARPDEAPTNVTRSSSARIDACPPLLSQMPAGSHIRAFAINMGDTSGNDANLSAYFDSVEVALLDDFTVFNFEPRPRSKEDCAGDNWRLYKFRNQGQCMKSI